MRGFCLGYGEKIPSETQRFSSFRHFDAMKFNPTYRNLKLTPPMAISLITLKEIRRINYL